MSQNVKFVQNYFISHLDFLRLALDYWQGDTRTQPMLIATLFQVQPESHQEPCNEAGS